MPPKMKKQPRNAYYFFMRMRKEQLEAEGYRFLGGMKDVANAVGAEWAAMGKEAKAPFEEEARLAKQDGKSDLSNKYTVTGESYAQVQKRINEERELAEEQENYIAELGMGEGALDRMFVFIKTIHCVEQIIERNQRVYWPLEIAMCAFSFREGLRSVNWTLVDTERTPVGYASAAKETSEETGLPEPGSKMMEEYRDYDKIMRNIKGFIVHWTKLGYRKGPVVFAMEQEIEHARGCLNWLINHMNGSEEKVYEDHRDFVDTLKMYKLPKLILRVAEYAHQVNPEYDNIVTQYRLENAAASIVNKGCYDYRDEITCLFHKREQASLKMHTCCRNIVLKRMFLLFEEFLPAFGLTRMDRHDIDQLGKATAAKSKTNMAARAAASARIQEENRSPVASDSIPSASGVWSKAPKVDRESPPPPSRSPTPPSSRSPSPPPRSSRKSPSPPLRSSRRSPTPLSSISPSPPPRSSRRSPSPPPRSSRRSPTPPRRRSRRSPPPSRGRRDESPLPYRSKRDRSPQSYRSKRDESPQSYRSKRDESPQSYRSKRDESPQSYRGKRDESPQSYRSKRDESPLSYRRNSPPSRSRRDESPPLRSRRDESPPFRSRRGESPPLRSRRGESPPYRSRRDDSPPPRSRRGESPPYRSRRDDSPPPRSRRVSDRSDSSYGGRQKRKQEEYTRSSYRSTSSGSQRDREGPPSKVLIRDEEDWEAPDDFNNPPSPSLIQDEPMEAAGGVPWGRKQEVPSASFAEDDFPALGATPPTRHGGMGRGRGRRNDDDDELEMIGSFGKGGKAPSSYY